jgi:hypothetical protein
VIVGSTVRAPPAVRARAAACDLERLISAGLAHARPASENNVENHRQRQPATGALIVQPDWDRLGFERDLDAESDRFRDLSPTEQRLAAAWRDGEDLLDRQRRARFPLGHGTISQRLEAWQPLQRYREKPISHVITAPEFLRMYKAVATANMQSLVLNTFLTVSWEVGGAHDPNYVASLHARLLASMQAWANDREKADPSVAVPMAAILVKEMGHQLGLHSHFLLNVPACHHITFRNWVTKAARRLLEMPTLDPRQPVPKLRLTHTSWLGDDTRHQWNVFKYMMKALDEDVSVMVDSTHRRLLLREAADVRPQDQGRVRGRRVGRTRNLGPATLRRLEAIKGSADIWGENDQRDNLRYGDHFLRYGELREALEAVIG